MKLRTLGYAALMTVAVTAFVLGTAGSSEAAKKKAEPAPLPGPCFTAEKPVCATRGGMKFTYASACIAVKDGAKVVSQKACPAAKAAKPHMKSAKKMAKPAKKKEMKK
jgi:hypothetical protein